MSVGTIEVPTMTGRDVVNGQLRRYRDIFILGDLVTTAGLVIAGVMLGSGATVIGGLLFVVLATLYLYLKGVRCPWCGGRIRPSPRGEIFTMNHVQFCFTCGKSLDDDLTIGGGPKKKAAPWDELA
jgi:hypothetical protein